MAWFRPGLSRSADRLEHWQVCKIDGQWKILSFGEEKMIKTIILSMCLAVSSLSLNARAQDERQYTEGPVTFVQEIAVEYGHFEEYIDWLNSTWKPTMEAAKKAGIIIDYKVFSATPQSPDHPSIILWITPCQLPTAPDAAASAEDSERNAIGTDAALNACFRTAQNGRS